MVSTEWHRVIALPAAFCILHWCGGKEQVDFESSQSLRLITLWQINYLEVQCLQRYWFQIYVGSLQRGSEMVKFKPARSAALNVKWKRRLGCITVYTLWIGITCLVKTSPGWGLLENETESDRDRDMQGRRGGENGRTGQVEVGRRWRWNSRMEGVDKGTQPGL